ncbi:MAG: response regulator [Sphingopyxis sp.]|nr:response regulator [Sphingopyxis sp.]
MPNSSHTIVLIVEDDPLVLLAAVDMIEDAGFGVLQANSADAAILLLEEHSDIHIVFTDIEMPGSMNGVKLAACIRDRWPPIEIIATSGRLVADDISLPLRSVFLPKPYRAQELMGQVTAMARS